MREVASKKIIHRDLTLKNILVHFSVQKYRVKLADFDILHIQLSSVSSSLTRSSVSVRLKPDETTTKEKIQGLQWRWYPPQSS